MSSSCAGQRDVSDDQWWRRCCRSPKWFLTPFPPPFPPEFRAGFPGGRNLTYGTGFALTCRTYEAPILTELAIGPTSQLQLGATTALSTAPGWALAACARYLSGGAARPWPADIDPSDFDVDADHQSSN